MSFIETERLLLRAWMPSDAQAMVPIFGDTETMRYIARGYQRGLTEEETRRAVGHMIEDYERTGSGIWPVIVKQTGAIVGECGLIAAPVGNDMEVAFIFSRSERGKGYAYEAASAVIDYGFDVLALPRIVAFVHPFNSRSIALIHRLGMSFDRVVRAYRADLLRYTKERP